MNRAAALSLVLVLPAVQGCTTTTDFARPGTDAAQIEADSSSCAEVGTVVVSGVATAGFGALFAGYASSQGASRDGAIAFGILGALYGLTAALVATQPGRDHDHCMQRKGYHPV
jgi:H+/gluconate symporter-like permease